MPENISCDGNCNGCVDKHICDKIDDFDVDFSTPMDDLDMDFRGLDGVGYV